jgi:hypothetical protein
VADGHLLLLRWQQLLGRLLVQTGSDVQKALAVGWRVGVVAVTAAHHHLGRPVQQTEKFWEIFEFFPRWIRQKFDSITIE